MKNSPRHSRTVLVIGLWALLAFLSLARPGPAGAASYTVTTLNDSGAGSLREAVTNAADGDTIEFDSSLSGTITLTSDLPRLNSVTFANGADIDLARTGSTDIKGLRVRPGATLSGELPSSITVPPTGSANDANGIYIESGSSASPITTTLGTVSNSITVKATGFAFGIYSHNNYQCRNHVHIDTFSGDILAESSTDGAAGMILNTGVSTIDELSGTITAKGRHTAGVYTFYDLAIEKLSGDISVSKGVSDSWYRAWGLFSDDNIAVGELSGTITAHSDDNWASGIRTVTGNIAVDTLSGKIAASTNRDNATAIYAEDGDIDITTLSGSVTAHADGDLAMTVWTESLTSTTVGELSGEVSATADGGSAAAFVTPDLAITTLSGLVSARAGAGSAYGMSGNTCNIGTLSGTVTAQADGSAKGISTGTLLRVDKLSGRVSASSDNDDATALSGGATLYVGELSGEVSATTDADGATAMRGVDVEVNTLSGTVSATADGSTAYGLRGTTTLNVGTLSGTVTAEAGNNDAKAVYSATSTYFAASSTAKVTTLSGTISATTGGNNAHAFETRNGLTVDTLSGTVTANAGGTDAHGFFTNNINGDIKVGTLSGTVTATAKSDRAYGFRSRAALDMDNLSGAVTATAGGYGAFGINAAETLQASGGGAANISGAVTATANGLAVAVGAGQGMNLHVTGDISATDTSGTGKAYAIAAGAASGSNWSAGGNYADTVTLGNGADITGAIDLGGGTNLLTLADAGALRGDISNITTLTKSGAGTWATTGQIGTADLTVDSGTLLVNVSQSATPTVAATGTVTNDGTIRFHLDDAVTTNNFTVLTGAALAGSGDYVTDSLLLTAAVNGNQVDLGQRTFSDVFDDADSDQRQIAEALDDNYSSATGELRDLIDALEGTITKAEANAMMEQMSSSFFGQGANVGVGTAQFQSLITQLRMAELRSTRIQQAEGGAPDPNAPDTWPSVAAVGELSGLLDRSPEQDPNGLYLRIVKRTGSMDAHGGQNGYNHHTTFFSGGYDRVLGDNFLAGVSAGYDVTSTSCDDAGESSFSVESFSLGVYGSWFRDDWYVDTLLAGALHHYDMNRRLPALGRTAEAAPDGLTLSGKVEGGYRLTAGGWGLTPRASLEYTHFHQDGYTETGAGAANMIVGDTDSGFFESGLGLAVNRAWETDAGTIIPEVSAMWLHQWLEQDRDVSYSMTGMPTATFSQTMAKADDDALRVGAGMRLLLDKGMSFAARYQGEMEAHACSHSFMFEAQWMF